MLSNQNKISDIFYFCWNKTSFSFLIINTYVLYLKKKKVLALQKVKLMFLKDMLGCFVKNNGNPSQE